MKINKIYCMDCIEGMKQLDDESIDAVVTDPPYFLINKEGKGFMNKEWDSIKKGDTINILCKSKEYAKTVVRFFMFMRVELSGAEANIVLKNAKMRAYLKENPEKSNANVQYVAKSSGEAKAMSKANINFVQGIVLTKEEVWDMLQELSITPIILKKFKNLSENVSFVVPVSFLRKRLKNIVPENVLKFPIRRECKGEIIHLTLMEEARIEGVIEGMIGNILEEKFMKEINIPAKSVGSIVEGRRYKHIILSPTEKKKIIQWITLLLFVLNATPKWKANQSRFLVYNFYKNWSKEALRVLKPGGYLLCFGGSRTYHRIASGIEDAGFEIRDQMQWIYSSGFPKSYNIGKGIYKYLKQGNASWNRTGDSSNGSLGYSKLQFEQGYRPNDYSDKHQKEYKITEEQAKQWERLGTALKPAHEPIVIARKPLSEKNIVLNVLKWGTGGLNIDGCRIETHAKKWSEPKGGIFKKSVDNEAILEENDKGRFPANIMFDEEAGKMLDEQSGVSVTKPRLEADGEKLDKYGNWGFKRMPHYISDKGGASRFFYCPKASRSEREKGLDELNEKLFGQLGGARQKLKQGEEEYLQENHIGLNKIKKVRNNHPTVKPIKLMRYLVRLVTPPQGLVLDPFIGSGTTAIASYLEGFNFIGFEKEKGYCEIANVRIKYYMKQKRLFKC